MSRRAAALGLVGLVIAGCGAVDDGLSRVEAALASILATVARSSGDLQVKHAAQGAWEPAGIATVLSPGDWLKTGRGASASVEFLPGGAIELDEEAVVVIEALAPLEKGDDAELPDAVPLLAVQTGSLRSSLSGQRGESRPLLVRTKDGAQARLDRKRGSDGVEARVAAVAGQTEVAVVSGEISLRAGGGEAVVGSGSVATLREGRPTTAALLRSPGLEAPADNLRLQAGAVTFRWQPVEGASRYRLQLSKDATFARPTLARELEASTVEVELPVGTTWWRVAARDERGRDSRWAGPRRVFLLREPPREALLAPDDGALFGFADAAPRIAFAWRPEEGARAYRLVIGRTRDVLASAVVSEIVGEASARVETLQPGEYFWGAFLQGAEPAPLFSSPRRLVVKKVKGSAVIAPKRIRRWGE